MAATTGATYSDRDESRNASGVMMAGRQSTAASAAAPQGNGRTPVALRTANGCGLGGYVQSETRIPSRAAAPAAGMAPAAALAGSAAFDDDAFF